MDSLSEAHHDAQRHGEREAGLWSKLSSVVACLLEAVAGVGSISDVLLSSLDRVQIQIQIQKQISICICIYL